MLEHLPHWLGALMHNVRAGGSRLLIVQPRLGGERGFIELSSPAFEQGGRLPARYTADGEGLSPPLAWGEPPPGTESLALIVEDPDAPAPNPLVHAIAWCIRPDRRELAAGQISANAPVGDFGEGDGESGFAPGLNSLLQPGWLPPDPQPGHGTHDYVFQLFALGPGPSPAGVPGRAALLEAMAGRVLAAGLLVGRYGRD